MTTIPLSNVTLVLNPAQVITQDIITQNAIGGAAQQTTTQVISLSVFGQYMMGTKVLCGYNNIFPITDPTELSTALSGKDSLALSKVENDLGITGVTVTTS